jgi:hypothetical protein
MSVATVGAVAPAVSPLSVRGASPPGQSFGAILEARSSLAAPTGAPPAVTRLSATAARALAGIERAQAALDGLIAAARSGRTFTAQELLALQGEAYRYSQTVELSARLVEQGAQAVKHALQTQV